MQTVERLMSTSPGHYKIDQSTLADCIEACVECELACTTCADACLAEAKVEQLRRCIRLNLDCADVCGATAPVLARASNGDLELMRAQVEACMSACAACGAECERHASEHEHCRICAEQCRSCEDRCRQLIRMLPGAA